MPVIIAAIARQVVLFAITYVAAEAAQKVVAPVLKNTVDATAAHYGIPESDAKIQVANAVIDNGVAIVGGAVALKSRLPLVAADYLGLTAAGFKKQTVSVVAAKAIATVDASPTAATAAKSIFSRIVSGENLWKLIITIMGAQQIGDWFIFGKPQLQGYLDAALGKGAVQLPSAPTGPAPWPIAEWNAYVSGLEQASIVGIEGGAVAATLLYSRDVLTQLAWWAYSEQLKNNINPTTSNVKPIIFPHLRFKGAAAPASTSSAAPAKTGTTAAASSASGGGTSAGKVIQAQETITPSLSSGTFIAPNTAYIDNAQELQTQAAQALLAFISTLGGSLVLQISTVTHYVDDSGKDHYAGVAQVQAGTNKDGTAKYKKYTGHFAMLTVYYDIPGPGRTKLLTIPLGSLNVAAYRPTVDELAQVVSAVSLGTAAQVASSLAPQAPANGTSTTAPADTGAAAAASSSTGGGIDAAATAAGVNLTPAPTAEQLANRNNPIPVTVSYPTTGLFHNTGGFGEEMSKRVGNTIYRLYLLGDPFTQLVKGVIGGGAQASIVDAWLKTNFGFDVMSLPTFNYGDLTTDRSITLDTGFTSPGQPGAGITDPLALIKLFLSTNATPAGTTTAVLNGPVKT